jgi:hypothetical protein
MDRGVSGEVLRRKKSMDTTTELVAI